MKTVSTYTATIYVGTREEYGPEIRSSEMARQYLKDYVNQIGLCVTLSTCEYIYKAGSEPGISVGLINYPRFPATAEQIEKHALTIAKDLLELYHQLKVTVVLPDRTVMIERSE